MRNRNLGLSRAVAWGCMIVALVLTVFPFYWMVRTALTPAAELVSDSGRIWPSNPTLINFQRVLGLVSKQEAVAAGAAGRRSTSPSTRSTRSFTRVVWR